MDASRVEKLFLNTPDGVKIAADFYLGSDTRGVLLLHMMPADKNSWKPFAQKLQSAGFSALAIDLRGHGESQGGPEGYKNFTDEEHQKSYADAEAGVNFMYSRGMREVSIAGASIGANIALQYAAANEEIGSVLLFSPGLEYRGIKTLPSAAKLMKNQRVYLISSSEDARVAGAARMSKELYEASSCPCKYIKEFPGSEHGTEIIDRHPEFMDEIIVWLINT